LISQVVGHCPTGSDQKAVLKQMSISERPDREGTPHIMTKSFAPYDRRSYPTLDVLAGYAAWAPSYDDTADHRLDVALLSSLTSVDFTSVKRAADLACGTGRIGSWLRARGTAHLDGVDMSAAMLERANLKNSGDGASRWRRHVRSNA
jgi:SAM-dependent methyltransferase